MHFSSQLNRMICSKPIPKRYANNRFNGVWRYWNMLPVAKNSDANDHVWKWRRSYRIWKCARRNSVVGAGYANRPLYCVFIMQNIAMKTTVRFYTVQSSNLSSRIGSNNNNNLQTKWNYWFNPCKIWWMVIQLTWSHWFSPWMIWWVEMKVLTKSRCDHNQAISFQTAINIPVLLNFSSFESHCISQYIKTHQCLQHFHSTKRGN